MFPFGGFVFSLAGILFPPTCNEGTERTNEGTRRRLAASPATTSQAREGAQSRPTRDQPLFTASASARAGTQGESTQGVWSTFGAVNLGDPIKN